MPLADYAHWNEDAEHMWWQEEGRHDEQYNGDDYYDEVEYEAQDLFYEEVAEMETEQILAHLCDADYRTRWPKAVPVLEDEYANRSSL